MRRAFYEWGAIVTLAITLLCFGYWAVSATANVPDFEMFLPLGHWSSTQILASQGTITINDHSGSKEAIETLMKYRIVNPPLTSKFRWSAPGISYQSINWGGQLSWSLQLSLLVPTFLAALAAAFFTHGYLRVRHQALNPLRRTSRHRTVEAAAGS
jgi:hypothetical protein